MLNTIKNSWSYFFPSDQNSTVTNNSTRIYSNNSSMTIEAVEAIKEENFNRLNDLFARGLDPNSRDQRGFSLIHIAVLKSRIDSEEKSIALIETLLKNGAHVNAFYVKDNYGPLTTAVRRKLSGIVELLLKKGADTSLAIRNHNKTALDYAKEFKDERGLKVLECFNRVKKAA